MSHIPKTLGALSRLLSYPDQGAVEAAELLFVVLQFEIPEAAGHIARFGAYAERHETWEIEEAFTRMFDVNPACALEVGWHLFGEEYARGMFLVRMREELRKYDLPESAELPDHLSHVLAVVAAMPAQETTRFVQACVLPAVLKMREAVEKSETPYADVIACLAAVLTHCWGALSDSDNSALASNTTDAKATCDPLHAFPVADVDWMDSCGCNSSRGAPAGELVQIDTELLSTAKAKES